MFRITKGSSRTKKHRKGVQTKLNNLNPNDPNWIDRYVEISVHLSFGDYDIAWFEDVHLDILRDLCNEDLHSDYVLHLLTLLELMVPLLDSEEKIEQTIGSLLNIVTGQGNRTPLVMNKYIYSAASLVLGTQEWRFKSRSIEELYNGFIRFLLEKSRNCKSTSYEACFESLSEIATLCPEMLESANYHPASSARNLSETLCTMAILDSRKNGVALRELTQNIRFAPDLKFHHISAFTFSLVNSSHYNDLLSLLILKPFLHRFISSNSIHDIHLALKLLIKFGFEIFSSLEEEFFMKQLVTMSTLPSLPIGYRLLCLSFIKIAFVSIYKPPLNSPPLGLIDSLCPYLFDGPDTQEKKLTILNEFSFVIGDSEFFNLIARLHRLSDAQYSNHMRATGSLFRILHVTLKKRPQLMERILNFLLESVFSLSYVHYIEKLFTFLGQHWDFAQLTADKFIARLIMLETADSQSTAGSAPYPLVRSYSQYLAFLQLINWFLSVAHHHIVLTEFQLEFIINFFRKNCLHWPQSSTTALTCCTSILYYQRVTPKVKEALFTILEWLKSERKMDIETSSLAQIYLLALRTLKEEYIKQVFTSDEEEFLIQTESFDDYLCSIVRNERSHCPLTVTRLDAPKSRNRLEYGSPLWLAIPFSAYLSADSSLDRLFCVDIEFSSEQITNWKQTFQLPFIEKRSEQEAFQFSLNVDFKINNPFWLDVSIRFVDNRGTIYNYTHSKCEFISLEDIFIPIDLPSEMSIDSLVLSLLQHTDSLQTVVCIREHHSFETFFNHYGWMKEFVLAWQPDSQHYNIAIGLSPDMAILGTIKLVNGFINLFLTTNNYKVIPFLLLNTFASANSK